MVFWRKKKRQPPAVSCYGKLPATGDFIRFNAMGAVNSAFDAWLANSVHMARESMGAAFEPCYQPALGVFVYRGDDANGEEPERGMVGVWAASGDSAGRRYPMTVACCYDYEEMLALGPALPIAAWSFITAAYDLCANGRSLPVDQFLARVQQLNPISLEDPDNSAKGYQRWLKSQSMRSLWETGFGSAAARHAIVYNVQATVEIFRGQERPQTSLAIRFPLRAGDAYAAAVWMDMTLRLAGWGRTVLNAFWTPQHDLMLHIGAPHGGTFRELISNGTDADHVTDLLAAPSVDEATARQRLGSLGDVVDDADQSIASFLGRLSAR
jgi:type VI secretion system protein ImpM